MLNYKYKVFNCRNGIESGLKIYPVNQTRRCRYASTSLNQDLRERIAVIADEFNFFEGGTTVAFTFQTMEPIRHAES